VTRAVVVTGIGPVTSIGLGRQAFWDALTSGQNGIGEITQFDTEGFPARSGRFAGTFARYHATIWDCVITGGPRTGVAASGIDAPLEPAGARVAKARTMTRSRARVRLRTGGLRTGARWESCGSCGPCGARCQARGMP
jgi:hypothetical protein